MTALRVLIGCECSGIVRRAFATRGHDVWSVDLKPAEEAKAIKGFPHYLITTFGRVISLHKKQPRLLSQSTDAKGYRAVNLRNHKAGRSYRVHRLVAEAFIANPEGLPCVRHMDGNPANNSLDNLAWGTYADNEADKRNHGTWDTRRNGKLTLAQRFEIRSRLDAGESQKEIAKAFGVSRPTITRIANGTIWGADA